MIVPHLRTGCDLVDIDRLGAAIRRRPQLRERVFTTRELDDACRDGVDLDSPVALARLAARFAAKEAGRKALGDLRLPFHALEVHTTDDGAPELWLHGERSSLQCSLSHDGGLAMAVVVGFTAGSLPPEALDIDTTATDTSLTDPTEADPTRE